jgi:hypothetical protein
MALPHKGFLIQRFSNLKAQFRRAFALEPEGMPLSIQDLALLDRVAETVVKRDMAAPAIVFLESVGPMNFLGSQALHFFTPLLEMVFPQRDVQRVALLLERRDTLSRLASLIESRARATHEPPRP